MSGLKSHVAVTARWVCLGAMVMWLFASCRAAPPPKREQPLRYLPATPYVQEIASDAPLGHWRLDEGVSGALTVEVESGASFDGQTVRVLAQDDFGGRAWTVELWASQVAGGALLSYVDPQGEEALSLRCVPRQTRDEDENDADEPDADEDEWVLEVSLLGLPHETGVSCPTTSWRHMAVTWRGERGALRVMMDGRLVWRGLAAPGETVPLGGALVLGQRQGCVAGCFRDGLRGALDEVAVYDRVLEPNTMLSHVLVARGLRTPSPLPESLPLRIQPQVGRASIINEVSFSPDSGRVALGDVNGLIEVRELESGRLVFVLDRHQGAITALAWTPDGRWLISASRDGSLKLWDMDSGRLLHDLNHDGKGVSALGIGPAGGLLASLTADALRLWGADQGRLRHRLAINGPDAQMALSPDGRRLAFSTGERAGQVRLVEPGDGREVASLAEGVSTLGLTFSADSRWLAMQDRERHLSVFDAQSGQRVARLEAPVSVTQGGAGEVGAGREDAETRGALHFSPDGERLAYLDAGARLRVWSWRQAPRPVVLQNTGAPGQVAFTPDGRRLIVAALGEPTRVLDAMTGAVLQSAPSSQVLALSPDGQWFATGDADVEGQLLISSVATGQTHHRFVPSRPRTSSAHFSADGRHLVVNGHEVRTWDADTGRMLRALAQGSPVLALALSPVAPVMVTATGEREGVSAWRLGDGQKLHDFEGARLTPRAHLNVSPDGRWLAVTDDVAGGVWEMASGRRLWGASGKERVMGFGPEGRLVLGLRSEGGEATPVLLDARRGEEVLAMTAAPTSSFKALMMSPDGETLLGLSARALWAWDARTGERAGQAPLSPVKRASWALDPSGERLAVGVGSILEVRATHTLELWCETGVEGADILDVAYEPHHGRALVTLHSDRTVRLWDELCRQQKVVALDAPLDVERARLGVSPEGYRVAVAARDGSVHVVNLVRGERVVLLARQRQWLAWSEDGFFDASADGASLVAMGQGRRVFGVEQLALTRNRPDVLMKRLGGVDFLGPSPELSGYEPEDFLRQASALGFELRHAGRHLSALHRHYRARFERRQRQLRALGGDPQRGAASGQGATVRAASQRRLQWPDVRVLHVEQDAEDGHVTLSLSFRDRRGLKGYQIYVNDVPVWPAPRLVQGRYATVSERVELSGGRNKIEIAAYNVDGLESLRAQTFVERPEQPAGALFFIGFGVSDYLHNPQIPDLQFAHQDVLDLADYFERLAVTPGHFTEVRVHALTDAQVTPQAIDDVRTLLAEASIHDTVILFVAGHGVRDLDAAQTYYYLTHGARLDDLSGTAVLFERLEALLYEASPRRKLFLMDTCQSGEVDDLNAPGAAPRSKTPGAPPSPALSPRAMPLFSTRTARAFGARAADAWRLPPQDRARLIDRDLFRRSGAIVLSSSRGQEASLESARFENGAFTEALIRALRTSAADEDQDGLVNTDELRRFVMAEVPELTRGRQHPTVDRDNLTQRVVLPILSGP